MAKKYLKTFTVYTPKKLDPNYTKQKVIKVYYGAGA
jgi:hypothetical protein